MVKSDKDKLEIYAEVDKNAIKVAILLFAISAIASIFSVVCNVNVLTILLLCITLLTLIISIVFYKNIPEEPKLQVVLTKMNLELHKRNRTVIYDTRKIISFDYDNSSGVLDKVFIKYYNEKNKKVCKSFILRGMEARNFVHIANGVLKQKDSIDNGEILKDNDDKENKNNEMQFGNDAKILCYVGSEKLVTIINNKKYVDKMQNILHFVDEKGKALNICWDDIILEKDLSLNVNKFYAVKYDKIRKLYNIFYTDFEFDINIVNEYKNKLDIKILLICNDEIISKEIKILSKYRKIKKICEYELLLTLLVLSILKAIKKEEYAFIAFKVLIMLMFLDFIILSIMTVYVINKITKIE